MAITAYAQGTQAATLTTEHVLATTTTGLLGIFILVVDTSALVAAETLVLKLKTKCLSGGTSRVAYTLTYTGVQTDAMKYSVPVPIDIELSCTLTQTGGTGRSYPWKLLKV
jgi:hypothetical protein